MDNQPVPTFQCQSCGKTTNYRPSVGKNGKRYGWQKKQRFCSRACGYAGRPWRPINPDGYLHSTGYMRVRLRGGQTRFKHQLAMEESLGRPLRKGENVHHKDGCKTNNNLDNLELWVRQQPPGQRVIDRVDFAIEILRLYPDFARRRGVELREFEPPISADSGEIHRVLSLPV